MRLFLESQGYAVTWARDGREGEEAFRRGPFDLVVLDLMLPDRDGLAVCRAIRAEASTPIVMLTARTAEDEVVAGLEAGADDYVGKPFGSKELLARIRRCLERASAPAAATGDGTSSALRVGALELDPERREVRLAGETVKLTRTEFELLQRLMRSPGRVFTRAQLLEHAAGADSTALDRTIDTHVWSLRRKLGEPRGQPRIVLSEPGVGYRLNDGRER